MQQQMAQVLKAVAQLTKEVAALKEEKRSDVPCASPALPAAQAGSSNKVVPSAAWTDSARLNQVKKDKVTVCIKNDGSNIDLSQVKNIVRQNGIQVSKASVNQKNGDVYVDLPSKEQRDKLVPTK